MESISVSANPKDIKKKRKNKKKRRVGGPRQKVSSEDVDGDNEDEITRTVKLVDRMFGTSSSHGEMRLVQAESVPVEVDKSLLSIQHKNLNPQTELKRVFGKVVNQEQQKKRRGGNFRSIKVMTMTNPKDSWPPVNRTGLYMSLSQSPVATSAPAAGKAEKNLLFFNFEHCKADEIDA
jgi:hypothetical protein